MAGSTFRKYRQTLVPTTHQRAYSQAWHGLLGDVDDTLVDRVKQAVKARMPLLAPPDALTELGNERQIIRGPAETDAVYAVRVQQAWTAWPWAGTPYGLLQALNALGYTDVVLAQPNGGNQYTLDGSGNLVKSTSGSWTPTYVGDPFWSVFDVLFVAPLPGGWPPASNSDEANRIRRVIAAWKPGHATCNRIVIITSGKVWGYPTTQVWGAATGNWGSSTTIVWTP